MEAKTLTVKQQRFFESLKKFIAKHGQAPTVAELVKLLNFASPRTVSQYLEVLERRGLIARARYQTRGIRLVAASDRGAQTITIPVIASAGCDNVAVLAQQTFGDFICVAADLLAGKSRERLVAIKAVPN